MWFYYPLLGEFCFYHLQSMRSNLSSVLKDQSLLYHFHSFLKAEEAINILSFCLAVGKLNGVLSLYYNFVFSFNCKLCLSNCYW